MALGRPSTGPAGRNASPCPAATSSSSPSVEGPEVTLGRGRPETSTRVRVAEFEGPLGLLLSLIEARELDVLTVPLGALADAYLDALAGLDGDRLGNVSAFIAVAGQLILIKSRAMLPRPPAAAIPLQDEGPDPEAELRSRLLLYRAYRDAGLALEGRAARRSELVHREATVAAGTGFAGARPADSPLDPAILAGALQRLTRIAPPPADPPGVVARTITLGERAALIRAALLDAGAVVLQDLLRSVTDRVVVAVTFLALLELVKRREVSIEQAEPWGPIVVRPIPGAARTEDDGFDERLEEYA